MSGIEVIGLVLATIPLFISASEHYSDMQNLGKKFKHKRRTLENEVTRLGTDLAILQMSLQSFVADMRLDTVLKIKLTSDPGSGDWKRKDVQKEVASKLGHATAFFVGLMQRISEGLLSELQADRTLRIKCQGKVRKNTGI